MENIDTYIKDALENEEAVAALITNLETETLEGNVPLFTGINSVIKKHAPSIASIELLAYAFKRKAQFSFEDIFGFIDEYGYYYDLFWSELAKRGDDGSTKKRYDSDIDRIVSNYFYYRNELNKFDLFKRRVKRIFRRK